MHNSDHIYIYGAGKRGIDLLAFINEYYSETIYIDGFIDKHKEGFIDSYEIYKPDAPLRKNVKIVISVADIEMVLQIALELRSKGYKSVYWYNIKNCRLKPIDFFAEQCVSCNGWNEDTLFHIEIHAMDACNLNCAGCTHYAPVFDKEKPNTEARINDIALLRRKISSVVNFYILGGEPFLNNELDKYIEAVRKEFPDAYVVIVTNGLLIPKCTEKLLNYLSTENVCVSISEYAPTHQLISEIVDTLNKYNIVYNIRPFDKKQLFNKPLSKEKTGECYCISPGCVNIWNKKIARCPTLMYVTELNKKFNLDFPEEGIIDMESDISGVELKNKLRMVVPLCDYCSKNEMEWSTCRREPVASDFVKM